MKCGLFFSKVIIEDSSSFSDTGVICQSHPSGYHGLQQRKVKFSWIAFKPSNSLVVQKHHHDLLIILPLCHHFQISSFWIRSQHSSSKVNSRRTQCTSFELFTAPFSAKPPAFYARPALSKAGHHPKVIQYRRGAENSISTLQWKSISLAEEMFNHTTRNVWAFFSSSPSWKVSFVLVQL